MKILLAPISWLYGLVVWIRNHLYDNHILHSSRVSIPTICVGNLAVGGTGKTPMTEYLVSLLSAQYKVAVLSRGYAAVFDNGGKVINSVSSLKKDDEIAFEVADGKAKAKITDIIPKGEE